jgi:hypothetical protein
VIQDYREPWHPAIANTHYDLVTEHGGGLGEMRTASEFQALFRKSAQVLKPAGSMFFVNFVMLTRSDLAERLGKGAPPSVRLAPELYCAAVERAGWRMMDWRAVEAPPELPRVQRFFYGYARKPE